MTEPIKCQTCGQVAEAGLYCSDAFHLNVSMPSEKDMDEQVADLLEMVIGFAYDDPNEFFYLSGTTPAEWERITRANCLKFGVDYDAIVERDSNDYERARWEQLKQKGSK